MKSLTGPLAFKMCAMQILNISTLRLVIEYTSQYISSLYSGVLVLPKKAQYTHSPLGLLIEWLINKTARRRKMHIDATSANIPAFVSLKKCHISGMQKKKINCMDNGLMQAILLQTCIKRHKPQLRKDLFSADNGHSLCTLLITREDTNKNNLLYRIKKY